jgi:hypothetical protein
MGKFNVQSPAVRHTALRGEGRVKGECGPTALRGSNVCR